MKVEIIDVTPAVAKEWLGRNSKNRPLRKSHVANLAAAFKRGEYVMTHQGVAFGSDGELIDGQRRLSAIASLPPEYTFPMLVTTDLDRDLTFKVVDTQQATRCVGDALHVDRRIAECATLFARIAFGRTTGITPALVQPFVNFIHDDAAELLAFCGSAARTWSSVPVRCAAIYEMKRGDREYAKHVYRALVLAQFDAMPSSAQALFRSGLDGRVSANQSYDIFTRCVKVFSPENSHLTKIQVKNQGLTITQVREWVIASAQGKKKAPELALGAKGVPVLNSSRRAA